MFQLCYMGSHLQWLNEFKHTVCLKFLHWHPRFSLSYLGSLMWGVSIHATLLQSFYYLFTHMLHVSVTQPSSGRNIYIGNYTTDNGSIVFRILVTVMDNNSHRFLVIGDVVAIAALTIANCCTLFLGTSQCNFDLL
jgi:hypothetical protein